MASKRLVLLAESRRSVPLIVMVLLSIFRTSVEQGILILYMYFYVCNKNVTVISIKFDSV